MAQTDMVVKEDVGKPMRLRPCTRIYRQLRNYDSRRNGLPQRRTHHTILKVIPESMYMSNIIQTKIVFRNICVYKYTIM